MRRVEGEAIMKTAKATTLLLMAVLLLAWTLSNSGCGGTAQTAADVPAIVSGLEPFVGTAQLSSSTEGSETTEGTVTHMRDINAEFKVEATDPRASGSAKITSNYDANGNVSVQSWGTSVLTNGKGTWVCDAWTGAGLTDASGASHSFIYNVARGTGEYEGLTMYVQWHFTEAVTTMRTPSQGIAISGWIEKNK
jgi:hypothetical protein